jgi:hypothetical protein
MRKRAFEEKTIRKVVWDNPVAFYAQSGRLQLRSFVSADTDEIPIPTKI